MAGRKTSRVLRKDWSQRSTVIWEPEPLREDSAPPCPVLLFFLRSQSPGRQTWPAWQGSGRGTLTDSPCRVDLVQKSGVLSRAGCCHSEKEMAWAAGAEGALCPTCSQNNSGPEAETSTLQCSLFYVRGLGFLVFLRWGLISLNVLYQWITVQEMCFLRDQSLCGFAQGFLLVWHLHREQGGGFPECPFGWEQLKVMSITQACSPVPRVRTVPSRGSGLFKKVPEVEDGWVCH